jgi:putative ABC transport system permease protein
MLTNPLWEQFRDHQQAFSSMFAYGTTSFNLTTGGEARYALGLWASGDFFTTLGVPAFIGRVLSADDDRRGCAAPPAVISNGFWQREFGGDPAAVGRDVMLDGQNPIGQVFQIDEAPGMPQPLFEIVGLVKDTKYTDLREPFKPIGFLAASQADVKDLPPFLSVVLRSGPAALVTLTAEATAAIAQINPSIIVQYHTMASQVRESLLRERLMATLSGLFGGLAGVIATIGLYGVMSYIVARRRNEIGIRMALGADRREVVRMVMREAVILLGVGLVVGGALAVAAASTVRSLLFGLQPGDPATLVTAAVLLATVAMVASYVPALRASRLEPTEALREE